MLLSFGVFEAMSLQLRAVLTESTATQVELGSAVIARAISSDNLIGRHRLGLHVCSKLVRFLVKGLRNPKFRRMSDVVFDFELEGVVRVVLRVVVGNAGQRKVLVVIGTRMGLHA